MKKSSTVPYLADLAELSDNGIDSLICLVHTQGNGLDWCLQMPAQPSYVGAKQGTVYFLIGYALIFA